MPESVWSYMLAMLLPGLASLILTALLIRWAPYLGLVDLPDPRKVHTHPTPRAGGLAIYTALLLTSFLPWPGSIAPWFLLTLAVGAAIVLLGLLDDRYSLPWWLRLVVQALAAAFVLGWGTFDVGWLAPLALFWIVGLINAMNMLDNMDALSAGVATIAAAIFAVVPLLGGGGEPDLHCMLFVGSVLGFLYFNRPPARIFMGDAGSTFLGLFLAVRGLVLISDDSLALWSRLAPVAILIVPCYDLVVVVAIRLAQRRSPFHPDQQHVSHRLVALGLSRPRAVAVIHLAALAAGLAGLLLYRVDDAIAGLIASVAFVIGVLTFGILELSGWLTSHRPGDPH
jgi:UDP-GlcNAc:undecaprenyl-phosphate GlcNAc-1-phosphate transferase